MTTDFSGFSRWATGNLFDNRNRGIFSEWLVGQALGVIEADDVRTECGKQPAPQVWLGIRPSPEPGAQLEHRWKALCLLTGGLVCCLGDVPRPAAPLRDAYGLSVILVWGYAT